MNNRKVMEQALETLEWCEPDYDENPTGFKKWAAVMPILRETLVVPEQRKWVGLTDEEIETTWSQLWRDINQMKLASDDRPQKETIIFLFARAMLAKLKDKNK